MACRTDSPASMFLETSRVNRMAYNATVDLRPNTRVRVDATYASNEFARRLDGDSSFSTRIPRLTMEYQLARPLFVRVIAQNEATRRDVLRDYRTGEHCADKGVQWQLRTDRVARVKSVAQRLALLVSATSRNGVFRWIGGQHDQIRQPSVQAIASGDRRVFSQGKLAFHSEHRCWRVTIRSGSLGGTCGSGARD